MRNTWIPPKRTHRRPRNAIPLNPVLVEIQAAALADLYRAVTVQATLSKPFPQ